MSETKVFPVTKSWHDSAYIDREKYESLYQQSIKNPEEFWAEQAKRLDWFKPWQKVKDVSFHSPVHIQWYQGAELNVAYNCVDRHLKDKEDQVAIIWEPDNPKEASLKITYGELHEKVCRLANVLKDMGVKKGDRVTIYLPMIPEAAYSMLACARIGAVHSIVFAGFSPDALADRIDNCESEFLITADEGLRGGKPIPLKKNADAAIAKAPHIKKCLVVQRTGAEINWNPSRDIWYHEAVKQVSSDAPAEAFSSESPLFILYTSGSTSKPKGVLHTSGGYLVYASLTHQYIFDYKPGDIYWCAADVGWVTGHSYMIYGPLCNGATTLLFEGVPTWPSVSRLWEIIDKYQVNILYTAPTLIRSLMAHGEKPVKCTSRKSLKLLGSVGEPINPEAWLWYYHVAGDDRCPIVDTWWQTETGGIMITPLPGATDLKPGSATKPFFGIEPVVLNEKGEEVQGEAEGVLAIKGSWPGQMRTVYKDHPRFELTYFSQYKGYYFSGDGCRRDKDGDFWITGRVDDVLNVSGHRMGTAEIESALVEHPKVAESAVVGFPHDIKGQGIYCYVTLIDDTEPTEALKNELIQFVRAEIGAFAKPDYIQWAPQLPKTRSGKIMRRILRKIAENQFDQLGDTSTLADPQVVQNLIQERQNK
ncbi:MAG: acetate--CoA ligase [Bdellovibrionales bacterium]|nr:acetate--CoA ligase [Bdellovibrionales bacterium]